MLQSMDFMRMKLLGPTGNRYIHPRNRHGSDSVLDRRSSCESSSSALPRYYVPLQIADGVALNWRTLGGIVVLVRQFV
jgi:hypothetical protein